jgi:hypothetical protein
MPAARSSAVDSMLHNLRVAGHPGGSKARTRATPAILM